MMYVGIDIGGTNVKAGLIDGTGKVCKKSSIPTLATRSPKLVIADIAKQIGELTRGETYEAVGIGCPGAINSNDGIVEYSNNLYWKNVPLAAELRELLGGKPVRVSNDANVAALGETRFGAAKAYTDTLLITLGTGVGGGIVVDGKLFEGYKSMGAEVGHTVIVKDGVRCTCGRKGCLEAYASATALIRDTIFAMGTDFNSLMWKEVGGDLGKVDGRTAFECAKRGDATAKEVIDNYIACLGMGIVNLVNVFRSQAVILGGGVSAQGAYLTVPLQKIVDAELFGGPDSLRTVVMTAALGNDAGILGAAALVIP